MINKDEILLKEKENDGKSVFLYYDDITGLYLAFGPSAYYTTMVTNPFISFSKVMDMPVALLRRAHILYLRQGLIKIEHRQRDFYRFETKELVGMAGYEKWERGIRNKHQVNIE